MFIGRILLACRSHAKSEKRKRAWVRGFNIIEVWSGLAAGTEQGPLHEVHRWFIILILHRESVTEERARGHGKTSAKFFLSLHLW